MIQGYPSRNVGVVFPKTAAVRSRARRSRLAALIVILAVGFSSGMLLQLHNQSRPDARMGEAPNGPFAYFPR